jgi:hypothetical protein
MQGVDVMTKFYYARKIPQWGMPVVGLQDSPIIGKKLGGSLSEAYQLGG